MKNFTPGAHYNSKCACDACWLHNPQAFGIILDSEHNLQGAKLMKPF